MTKTKPEVGYENFLDRITDKQFWDELAVQDKYVCRRVTEAGLDGYEYLSDALNAEEKNYLGLMNFFDYYRRLFDNERTMKQIQIIQNEHRERKAQQRLSAKN